MALFAPHCLRKPTMKIVCFSKTEKLAFTPLTISKRSTILRGKMKRYYHICTKGLATDLLFRDTQEFIAGMNRIGVCHQSCARSGHPVVILAFCLMNTHVHFVLFGSGEGCSDFIAKYRDSTCLWIKKHRGERLHERVVASIFPISGRESVRTKIVYNIRQMVEARLNVSPLSYPWSSGQLMFADSSFSLSGARPMSSFSARAVARMVKSKEIIPGDWLVFNNGVIWPGSYTDFKAAEKFFASVGDFLFMVNNSSIDKTVNMEMMEDSPSIPDSEVRDKALEIARIDYGKETVSRCSADERIALARILRKEFHCGHRQLARVLGMNAEDLSRIV